VSPCNAIAASLAALAGALAFLAAAAPGMAAETPRTAAAAAVVRDPGPWATVNVCDTIGHPDGIGITLPLLGKMLTGNLLYLGFMFVFGVVAQLYKDRVPTHAAMAIAAAVLLGGSMLGAGFFVLGLPAYAYLVLWVAMRLRGPFQAVGRKRDYSYGMYIYAWPVQELLTMEGVPRWGLFVYTVLALLGGLVLAIFSWHLVERQALRLKDWTPPFLRKRFEEPHESIHDTAVQPEPVEAVPVLGFASSEAR